MGISRLVLPVLFCLSICFSDPSNAQRVNVQRGAAHEGQALVYVDKQGVMRWNKDHSEAQFFGVNYTVPFAYSYRAHRARGVDPQEAIRQDVYHMARLGVDAFRVHVWDTEISDSLGNLLDNEHLRLFDFLLAELSRRGIRAIITPIAFWGNGYPERDERTPGFSRLYGKGRATTEEAAIRAQENYLGQLFHHVNSYSRQTYVEDPNVIAVEINNEPSHSGPAAGVTAYINRLAAAIRATGWTKPLFYNISQSPFYAAAVAAANIQGVSCQWYPSGLVGGAELKNNFLPNVDHYAIPFDTIPAFRNKARMVYEFDAADMLQSDMYPAIARSFREAGFQWATQFAYDPMALAYANTEYQTHFLNLAYTPSKAISLLIASRAFHRLPRGAQFGIYPIDSVFDVFRVSYRSSLSEMNSTEEFYYSNSTTTRPVAPASLQHLAGVGNSSVVQYSGRGAYFLDKIDEGRWRLEVMPDAITIRDPFARPSPSREAVRIQWDSEPMHIVLPGLGGDFSVRGLNAGNKDQYTAADGAFRVRPGTYLVTAAHATAGTLPTKLGELGMNEFVAPQPFSSEPYVAHTPYAEVTANRAFVIRAGIVGVDSTDKVMLEFNRVGDFHRWETVMTRLSATDYSAEISARDVRSGELNYQIVIHKAGGAYWSFPGARQGNPAAWDYTGDEHWTTLVAGPTMRLEIFNATGDRPWIYPPFMRDGFDIAYVTGEMPGQLVLHMDRGRSQHGETIGGFQFAFTGRLDGRRSELAACDQLGIRARGSGPMRVTLTDADGYSYSAPIPIEGEVRDLHLPLRSFVPDSALLLPRPYPGFQARWFRAAGVAPPLRVADIQKVQVVIDTMGVLDLESIWFERSKQP
ncbi:MAG: membrane or secreted protein [Bacteroidota bacterium]|nr:membrane or secreted protein [Bacteroidota bacterium]